MPISSVTIKELSLEHHLKAICHEFSPIKDFSSEIKVMRKLVVRALDKADKLVSILKTY